MTHSDAGHYSAKHAPGESPDEKIAVEIRGKAADGELACAEAERIGATLGVPLAEIGRTLDLLELRIGRCQLGLFGYPSGKALHPAAAASVAPELEAAIRSRLADGKLHCKDAWGIAAEHKVARIKVSSACETLMIRIKTCQLGAF
jgi:hypothetical protein